MGNVLALSTKGSGGAAWLNKKWNYNAWLVRRFTQCMTHTSAQSQDPLPDHLFTIREGFSELPLAFAFVSVIKRSHFPNIIA